MGESAFCSDNIEQGKLSRLRLDERKKLLEPHLQTAYDFVRAHIEWIGSAVWLGVLLLISKLSPSAGND